MRSWLVGTAGGLALIFTTTSAAWAADDRGASSDADATAHAAETSPAADGGAAVEQAVAETPAELTEAAEVADSPAPADDSLEAETAAAPANLRPLRHGVFRWTSYPAAWTAAQKTNRPILMFVTAPGCPHCVKMIAETYQARHISPLVVDSFETVYVDRATQPELVAKLQVRWFPTTIVVGTNNKVIDVLEGYIDPLTFSQRLKTGLAASHPETQTR